MSVVEAMLRSMASIRIYRKNDGTTAWRVLWRDAGKQRSRTFNAESDALTFQQILDANGQSLTLAVQAIARVSSEKPTVAKMLEEHIDSLTRPTEGTKQGYRQLVRDHLTPPLGALLVAEVTPEHLGDWIRWERGPERRRSVKTITNAFGLLSSAFKTAVRRGWRDDNPCDQVRLPREQRTSRRATFLTRAEVELLLEHMPAYYHPITRLLVESGMRYSEVSALKVMDLDMSGEVPIVHVTKAWTRDDHRRDIIGPPKNDQSVRDVSIRAELAKMLLDVERRSDWLVENKWGGPLRNTNFHQAAWQRAVEGAQGAGLVKSPRPHDLRHTHASWLLAQGVPLFVVSRRLGHASVETTTRIYGHLMPGAQAEAVAAIERIFA